MPGIYDEPELYEAACAYRDVPGEVNALLRWSGRHRHPDSGPPRSVLELAAGPAEHSRELARRGLDATALDLSAAMCARARELAAADTTRMTVIQADMRDFSLGRQFDLAITMLNSLCHLLTLDDLLQHLASVARHLAPGSLYITELAHPADFFAAERRTSSEWSSQVDGGTVRVRWGGGTDEIDPVTQITREHVSITYHKRGGSLRTVADVVPNRFWTATELTAAIRLAGGFTVVASYGDFEADISVAAADAWRMILVLRREDASAELPGPPLTATARAGTATPATAATGSTSRPTGSGGPGAMRPGATRPGAIQAGAMRASAADPPRPGRAGDSGPGSSPPPG